MLDTFFIRVLKSPLITLAKCLDRYSIRANWLTWLGFGIGIMILPALYAQHTLLALLLLLGNRLLDGLDGAVARIQGVTDLGGFLDITLDFIFYSCVVFGFALMNPVENSLAACFLIFSFMGTGSSFLAFAIMAEKRKIERVEYGHKSLYYLGGLMEGSETILFFIAFCLFPSNFAALAYLFGGLCWVTTATRIYAGYRTLK